MSKYVRIMLADSDKINFQMFTLKELLSYCHVMQKPRYQRGLSLIICEKSLTPIFMTCLFSILDNEYNNNTLPSPQFNHARTTLYHNK